MKKVFTPLYEKAMQLVAQPHARIWLYTLSFFEAIIVPVPPDVMLAPMCATQPQNALRLGVMTTIFSVLGGVLGYTLGFFALEWTEPGLSTLGWDDEYMRAQEWFKQWGVGIILVAGFSPIPYKVFTLTAGALHFSLGTFVLFSVLSRGARFMLVAVILKYFGSRMLSQTRQVIEYLGWLTVMVLLLFVVVYYL